MHRHSRLRVLVLDDEPSQNDLLCLWLRSMTAPNFEPVSVHSLAAAYKALKTDAYDLALLDRRLGDGDGIEVLRHIRENRNTNAMPVIIMSGMSQDKHVVEGLQRGADAYLPKPCSESLFRAHVYSALRRSSAPAPAKLLEGPGFQLDTAQGRLFVDGRVEHLEPKELGILALFLRRPNVVHTPAFICSEAWGEHHPAENTLHNRLRSLRDKLGRHAVCIENVYGVGFRLLN